MESKIFFARRLDSPNHVERLKQIAVYTHTISHASGPPGEAASSAIELICPTGKSIRTTSIACVSLLEWWMRRPSSTQGDGFRKSSTHPTGCIYLRGFR
jgi:hypothetical protein